MQDPKVRDLVWKDFYEADVRYRYFGARSGKLKIWERRLALVVAAGSSSTFIALVVKIPHAPLVLSAIVAIAGAILASQKYEAGSALNADLGRRWGEIKAEYGQLWLEVDDIDKASALQRHRQIEEEKVAATEDLAMGSRVDSKLLDECQRQARTSGFEKAA